MSGEKSEAQAISAVRRTYRELADGTLRVQIDVDPRFKQDFLRLFPETDMPLAIAPLRHDFEVQRGTEYGHEAKALRLSGFFRMPEVWKAIGTDDDYLHWLKGQKCSYCGRKNAGWSIVPAHVRRVANGAGTGIKPEYSAIALCSMCHNLQHQKGEGALGGKEQFDKWRIDQLEQWAWETLKAGLGHSHWSNVPPAEMLAWAQRYELDRYLPAIYRQA